MFEVMIEKQFSAAHHLTNYHGKCENQHGHNFIVQVWLAGETLDKANLLVDPLVFDAELMKILDQLDHCDLNEFHGFEGESTSSEFISRYIFNHLKQSLPNVTRTCVFETPKQCAFYDESAQ